MADLPYDLLTKLLLFIRTPDPDAAPKTEEWIDENGHLNLRMSPEADDDFTWCYADLVSKYTKGWRYLEEAGFVETTTTPGDPDDPDLLATGDLVVRFTEKGLQYAIDANVPQGIQDLLAAERKEEGRLEALDRNADRPGFGAF